MALIRNLSSVSGAIPRNAFYNARARSFEFREPISTTAMLFRSAKGSGRVVVTAFMTASHRVDTDVEKIVGRLSLEPMVSAARWQAEVQIESETPSPPEFSGGASQPDHQHGATMP
jgi:hypothetical protein